MTDDWQPGDLALCVRGGFLPNSSPKAEGYPVSGKIYKVEAVVPNAWFIGGQKLGLILADAPKNKSGERKWPAFRFRKIRPHQPDAEDAETIALLKGGRVPA